MVDAGPAEPDDAGRYADRGEHIWWAAGMALEDLQGGYEEALPPHRGTPPSSSLLQRVPVGVVAGITGYNFPINSVVWKLGPGLASGCTMVFKPSPRTPLSTMALVKLCEQVGLPSGVVNFVIGDSRPVELLGRSRRRGHGDVHRVACRRPQDHAVSVAHHQAAGA